MTAVRLFRLLSEYKRAEILSYAVLQKFLSGESVYEQGDPVRHVILLQSGIVGHSQASSDGQKALLRLSSCGDVLNAHDMFASGCHSSSARAMEKCEALVWKYGHIEWLCTKYPQLRNNLDCSLVTQLEELEERFREVATEPVARRLSLLLVRLCNQVGRKSAYGVHVSISREELAHMTGTTQYTISRLLARWAQLDLLIAQRKMLVVKDIGRLALVKDTPVKGKATSSSPLVLRDPSGGEFRSTCRE